MKTEAPALPEGVKGRLVLPAADYARSRIPWLVERRRGIGASEISAIMGQNKFVSPRMVWESKVNEEVPTDDMPEAAFWGLKNEHNVATVFAMRNPKLGKIAPTPGLIAHEDLDHLRVTMDRLLVKRRQKHTVAVAGVECKTVGEFAYKNYWIDGEPPVHIQLQTQWQSGITGLSEIYVPHLIGGNNLQSWKSEADQSVIDALFEFADNWWQKHVVGGEPPATTMLDADRMSEIWPARPPAKAITAAQELAEKIGKHLVAKQREKDAVADKKYWAYEIQKEMGDAEEILDPDTGRAIARWKRPKQSYTIDAKRLEEEKPEIYSEYLKPKSNPRTFTTLEIDV